MPEIEATKEFWDDTTRYKREGILIYLSDYVPDV